MKIGILGSGAVGVALAKAFITEGHDVMLATREPGGEKGEQLKTDVEGATITDFATAAQGAELAVLCVKWDGAAEAIKTAGAENLAGKIVIDTSNAIGMDGEDMVYGEAAGTSAAEQVQAWLPESKVVKGFNTMSSTIMYKPALSAIPTLFIAGDDAAAKQQVSEIGASFGWDVLDAGKLKSSREIEAMAIVMIRNSMATGDWNHTFKML